MAKTDLGTRRVCQNCAAKYYDFNRDPIVCPKCSAVFVLPLSKARPETARADDDEEAVVDLPQDAELISLEDADAEAMGGKVEDDIEDIGDDDLPADDDDTFLEEDEDENDDVSVLIDGDIENDEDQ